MALLKLHDIPDGEVVEFDFVDFLNQPWLQKWYTSNYGKFSVTNNLFPKVDKGVLATLPGAGKRLNFVGGTGTRITGLYLPVDAVVNGKISKRKDLAIFFESNAHGISTSGWDPEIFVEDAKGNLLPAFDFLPSKEKGLKTPTKSSTGKGEAYFDGFQAEFTTPPVSCHGYGIDYLRAGLLTVHKAAQKKSPGSKLSLKSVYRIPEGILMTAGEEHVALGCKPSQNAYGAPPLQVLDARLMPYRVAGGHIHFACYVPDPNLLVKVMDLMLALPCVGMFADIDNPIRREFYGKAGEYRKPSYGIEYRVLSNAWLCDPKVTHLVMDMARRAVAASRTKGDIFKEIGLKEEKLQEMINFCDVKSARAFVEKHWKLYMAMMNGAWPRAVMLSAAIKTGTPPKEKAMREIVFGGVGLGFPDYEKIEDNWKLTSSWMDHSNQDAATWSTHSHAQKYATE